jgi:hypothetical protein
MKRAPAPVLHWPKLFEGQVGLRTNKRISGNGDGWGYGWGYGGGGGNGEGSGWFGLID